MPSRAGPWHSFGPPCGSNAILGTNVRWPAAPALKSLSRGRAWHSFKSLRGLNEWCGQEPAHQVAILSGFLRIIWLFFPQRKVVTGALKRKGNFERLPHLLHGPALS